MPRNHVGLDWSELAGVDHLIEIHFPALGSRAVLELLAHTPRAFTQDMIWARARKLGVRPGAHWRRRSPRRTAGQTRGAGGRFRETRDPTPEEIEQRKREIRG